MTDWEKELSPVVKLRLAELGVTSQEDEKRIKELENLDALLEQFYKGQLDAGALWEKLREFEEPSKQFLLKDAYTKLRNSFKWKGLPIKFKEESDGTLAIMFREEEQEELVIELTDNNFDEAVKKFPVLVVDCWAEWCAPCRMVAPVIEELAESHQDDIKFAKLNIDYNRLIVSRYQVMSIPTLLIFKNGQLVDTKVGAMPRQLLEPELVKYI